MGEPYTCRGFHEYYIGDLKQKENTEILGYRKCNFINLIKYSKLIYANLPYSSVVQNRIKSYHQGSPKIKHNIFNNFFRLKPLNLNCGIDSSCHINVTLNGPSSSKNPVSELHPGPPFNQSTTGSRAGSFSDSTNLQHIYIYILCSIKKRNLSFDIIITEILLMSHHGIDSSYTVMSCQIRG